MWNPSSVEEAPGDRASGRQTKKWTTEETNKERWEEPQGNVTKRKKASRVLAVQLAQTSRTLVHSSMILIYDTVRKPLLRKGNKTKRLKYAWEHNNWNSDQWKKVLWSDKSKFEIFGSKRLQYVRRRNGEELQEPCLQRTVKHGGGSIQVLDCISAGGVGDLVGIDWIMNAEK